MRRVLAFPVILLLLAFLTSPILSAQTQPASTPGQPEPTSQAGQAAPEAQKPEAKPYTLSPERREKAVAYSRAQYRLYFLNFAYSLAVLWFFMRSGLAVKIRNWAVGEGRRRRIFQAMIFVPLFILALRIFHLPISYYGHHLERIYELSVQGLGSWLWDWTKASLILMVILTFVLWIMFGIIRRSPRRWWLYFWMASIPILIFLIFIAPVVIEPMFFKYESLKTKNPELVTGVDRLLDRAGLSIPEERMFWMKASEKTRTLNAYVAGIGASKRVVVWDTTLAKMTNDQTLFVFGHELGHYVLQHIWKLIGITIVVLFVFFWFGATLVHSRLRKWSSWTSVKEVSDWAVLPMLLFFLAIFNFLSDPITNSISRHYEHQADIYGLEITHGVVPNSGAVAGEAFQILGDVDLADPDPSRFIEFWLYSHPALPRRVTFAQTYNPWEEGKEPIFIKSP
jgi:Zn-dependent protease with chaperone function